MHRIATGVGLPSCLANCDRNRRYSTSSHWRLLTTRSCRMRLAAVGESIIAPGCRISTAARRGSIGGAGACSLAAPASRLAFPLSHTKQHCNPPEKEPKALKRMILRIHERSGGEPHCHPDCDSHPTSPAQRRPIAQANLCSEPVPRPIVHGATYCELTCLSSVWHYPERKFGGALHTFIGFADAERGHQGGRLRFPWVRDARSPPSLW